MTEQVYDTITATAEVDNITDEIVEFYIIDTDVDVETFDLTPHVGIDQLPDDVIEGDEYQIEFDTGTEEVLPESLEPAV